MNSAKQKDTNYTQIERFGSGIKQNTTNGTTSLVVQNHHCAQKESRHFSHAFWFRCAQVALALTVAKPAFAASGLYVGGSDETTVTSQITATATTFNKTGSGVAIIAPSAMNASPNSISQPVHIQAGTLQLNDTRENVFGSLNAPTITMYGGATLASGYSSGITLSNPIVIGEGASKTATITGLGYDGSGAQNVGPCPIELTGSITQPASNSENSLTIAGGSTVTLSGDNTTGNKLTGHITVNGSTTLNLNNTNAIPSANFSVVLGSYSELYAAADNTHSPAITLNGYATLGASSTKTLTASLGASAGDRALIVGSTGKNGTVALTDSRTSVTNGVTVEVGLLKYSVPPTTGTYTITVNSGAAVQVSGNATITNPLVFDNPSG
jgi:hypothetical protein